MEITLSTIPRTTPADYGLPITPDQRQLAWKVAYCYSLDQHPDAEIAWEADRWRELNAPGIAALCDALLHERRADDFSIPSETDSRDLTALWQRVPQSDVFRLVRSGGVCLLAATRLTFWLDLTAEEIAT
jgi:hypothetical protein